MTDREAGRYWEDSADSWTDLTRKGYNIYADGINIPALLEMLPDVAGLRGLDIGCGEGKITGLVQQRGASITALDLSRAFLRHARLAAPDLPCVQATGQQLPFADSSFDFAIASMSLMDLPRPDLALREAARVIRPAGFFQFSITHPCFMTRVRYKLRDANGRAHAMAIGGYFDRGETIDEWLFSGAPAEAKIGLRPFRLPVFYRTLSDWLNMIVAAGLQIERALEPKASDEVVEREPRLADSRVVAYFLHLRCRKVLT